MAKKTQAEIDAETEIRNLVRSGISEASIVKIDARALEIAKKLRPKRPREKLEAWREDLSRFRAKARDKLLEGALQRVQGKKAKAEEERRFGPEVPIPGRGGVPAIAGAPISGIPGRRFGIPPAPGQAPLPDVLPEAAVPFALPSQTPAPPPGPVLTPTPTPTPPIPLGQDPNLLTPDQNGPPLPTLGPQDLAPAPPSGAPTDPVTGLPPPPLPVLGLTATPPPGLAGVAPPPTEGLPPLPPLPPESLEPAPVATPQSTELSRRMIPQATQQESQDIAEALDFISSGDPSFFDLDEGPIEELQEGPLGPPLG